MQKKILKKFLDLEIIAFEMVVSNTRFCVERILVIGCQYVNKQSQDLLELIFVQTDQKILQK